MDTDRSELDAFIIETLREPLAMTVLTLQRNAY